MRRSCTEHHMQRRHIIMHYSWAAKRVDPCTQSVKAKAAIQGVDGDMTCSAFNCSVFRPLICILDCNLPVTVNDAGARARSLTHHHPSTWRRHVCTKAIDCSRRQRTGCIRPVNERCILYQHPFSLEHTA